MVHSCTTAYAAEGNAVDLVVCADVGTAVADRDVAEDSGVVVINSSAISTTWLCYRNTFDLLFTGRAFDVREAIALGLVSRAVPEAPRPTGKIQWLLG